jgi:hypothetical protein
MFDAWIRFADAYNDVGANPTIRDVGVALDMARQTVKNKASILRRLRANDPRFPKIITRSTSSPAQEFKIQPQAHAEVRAQVLAKEITSLLTSTRYPVVNPQALVVQSHMTTRYDRDSGNRVPVESTPRTYLEETLRVAPVKDARRRSYLFTGAQNDASVHLPFWKNLNAYAASIEAEIVVGPWTYETQWWSENNPVARAYDPLIAEHLCFGQLEVGNNFIFAGEMNTLPTASRPISDLLTYSRGRWAVFPHAKLQLKSVPSTDPFIQAHQVMTTGACTKPKIIPRKAGVKSIFHHVIGATLVEFDEDGDIFCRQINASDDGSFYDLDAFVDEGEVTYGHEADAITIADAHVRKLDAKNARATLGFDMQGRNAAGSLLELLKPNHIFLHDIHDNESRNHHHEKDNAHSYEMAFRGRESVLEEVKDAAKFLQALQVAAPSSRIMVVESNHDLALERYIREGRYRLDGINIRIGLQLEDAYLAHRESVADSLRNEQSPPSFSLLEYTVRMVAGQSLSGIGWVHDGYSFVLNGIELGHHGFRGANGARGSVDGFANMGRKMSIGDKHSPEILDGVYVSGVLNLRMGYNKGPSGWAVTHTAQYKNGKRTLITLQNGKFRAGRSIKTDLQVAA